MLAQLPTFASPFQRARTSDSRFIQSRDGAPRCLRCWARARRAHRARIPLRWAVAYSQEGSSTERAGSSRRRNCIWCFRDRLLSCSPQDHFLSLKFRCCQHTMTPGIECNIRAHSDIRIISELFRPNTFGTSSRFIIRFGRQMHARTQTLDHEPKARSCLTARSTEPPIPLGSGCSPVRLEYGAFFTHSRSLLFTFVLFHLLPCLLALPVELVQPFLGQG